MYDINFFTTENMALFWEFTKSLLKTAAPGVLISFAIVAVGWLIAIIVKAFRKGNNDDEEDYDTKYY